MAKNKTYDLRSMLEIAKATPGQYIETDVPINPVLDLPGVYRYIGAGGTVQRPTRIGPIAMFNKLEGYPGVRAVTGVLANRKNLGRFLGCPPEDLAKELLKALKTPIKPVVTEKAPCQEVVRIAADDPDFDVRKIIPAVQFSEGDGGRSITAGLLRAHDPETGDSDVTFHRMFFSEQPDELVCTCQIASGRHIAAMHAKCEEQGRSLPISVNIGLDPAVYMAACFAAPTTPYGVDELEIAGSLRGQGVELVKCLTVDEYAIANAEFVLECEMLPDRRERVDVCNKNNGSIPEFPGFASAGSASIPDVILKVKAITYRKNPIYEVIIGPSEEHVNLAGIATEASIMNMINTAMPGKLKNVSMPSGGGGKYMCVLQMYNRYKENVEGCQRHAAILAFAAFRELKHVILVDEDVDPFDMQDVMWAMNFRYQGDIDTIFIPDTICHIVDPSSTKEYSKNLRAFGTACKTIFDCTVPYNLHHMFERAQFKEIDYKKYFPDFDADD